MKNKIRKYDSYKDSGIEWIGEIPSHWDCKRLKQLVESPLKYGANEAAESDDPSQPRYIRITDFGQNGILRDDTFKSLPEHLASEYLLEEGDILLARSGATVGKTFLFQNYKGKACFAGYLIRCRFSKEQVDSRFINYYTFSNFYENWKQSIFQQATIQNIGADKYNQLLVSIPPQSEQTTIANYLDQKTTQIDDLIAKKERLIQLLEEERTAIINELVTGKKVWNGHAWTEPAEVKDSGIEWLGEIPEHWKEARIKNVVNIIGRIGFRGYTTQDLVQKGEGAISLSPSNIKNHILNIDDCTYLSWEKYHESPEIKIFENDIILVKTGSTIGKTAIIPNGTPEMTLNPQLVVFKDIKLNPVFLYYIMISNYFQGYFSIYTAGGSTPAISQEKINNFKITFPSELEQLEISNFISQKESEIKRIISKTQLEIELLKEYKTALISEVVTGKVDVRDEIIKQPIAL